MAVILINNIGLYVQEFKDNVSLTQEQVDSGKYGKLIPKDAKKYQKMQLFMNLLTINIILINKENM